MNYTQLTEIERCQIQSFLKAGHTQKKVAQELGRHPSTIGRELKRNAGLRGYRPKQAKNLTDERKHLYTQTRITYSTWQRVEILLREEWSPEQISGWLKKTDLQSVSPEWIYQYILTDKKAGGDLHAYFLVRRSARSDIAVQIVEDS
jgi:IS30 family transposase